MVTKNNNEIDLTIEDFTKAFNHALGDYTCSKISQYKLSYQELTKEEQEQWLLFIIKTLLSPNIIKAGQHRLEQWEKGWRESLTLFKKEKKSRFLTPGYFGKYNVGRWQQKLIKPVQTDFEWQMLAIIQYWLFEKYFKDPLSLYEFGCGTGHNLLRLREINPGAKLYGLDWSKSSQQIIWEAVKNGLLTNTEAYHFDFFNPNYDLVLDEGSGVCTVAALEQTGSQFKVFVDYLIKNKPKTCIHIEPIGELLDEKNLLDYLSIAYFKNRNYLTGFLNYLRELEEQGKIIIHQAQRTHIGSLFIEGYSVVVWSPRYDYRLSLKALI